MSLWNLWRRRNGTRDRRIHNRLETIRQIHAIRSMSSVTSAQSICINAVASAIKKKSPPPVKRLLIYNVQSNDVIITPVSRIIRLTFIAINVTVFKPMTRTEIIIQKKLCHFLSRSILGMWTKTPSIFKINTLKNKIHGNSIYPKQISEHGYIFFILSKLHLFVNLPFNPKE